MQRAQISLNAPIVNWVGGQSQTVFFLVLAIVGLHMRFAVYTGGALLVPYVISYIAYFSITVLAYGKLNSGSIYIVFATAAFVALHSIACILLGSDVAATLKGSAMLFASMVSVIGFSVGVSALDEKITHRIILSIWVGFIFLAVLEMIPVIRSIFEDVSRVLYNNTGRGNYESIERDVLIYGKARPKVFASEPSYLASTLSTLCLFAHFTDTVGGLVRRGSKYAAMMAISYFVSPSLSMIFFSLSLVAWYIWPKKVLSKFLFSLAIFAIATSFSAVSFSSSSSSSGIGAHMKSGSFFGRIVVGPDVALGSILKKPIVGYGVGASEDAYDAVSQAWAERGGYTAFPWFAGARASALMSNGFWWQWVYLGVLGGLIFNFLLLALLKSIGAEFPMRAVFCTWVIWYAGSAFVDVISWTALAVFVFADLRFSRPSLKGQR